MKSQLSHKYKDIISIENLCLAWEEFIVGKKKKVDVIQFGRNLMDNLESILPQIQEFLQTNLKVSLHPHKLFLKTAGSGVDFLGWLNFTDHRILRATTKRRMLACIKIHPTKETLQSYLGLLIHGNAKKNTNDLLGEYWLWKG